MDVIIVENLTYVYKDETKALDNVSISIKEGSKVALLGPNGAGKSTLLLHLNGIFPAQKGFVKILGKEISKKNIKWLRSKIGFVFQDPDDQVFSPTVREDVAFGPQNMGITGSQLEERIINSLKLVGMAEYLSKAPQTLSYGQKKRVAIAGVLAMEPEVIILDEPLAFLDPQGKEDLFGILNNLNSSGTTIIIATHDVNLAAEWADEIIIMKKGHILTQGPPTLLAKKELLEQANLTLPIVSKIFDGLVENNPPITIAQGKNFLNNLLGKINFF